MRHVLAAAAIVIAIAAFLPADTPVVTVHATCDGGQLGDHSVDPDAVSVAQDQSVDWVLDDASTATDLTVEPKHPGHWPFAHDENFKGGKGKSKAAHADGKHMNKSAAGTYPYTITLSCPDGHGGSTSVEIDPSIIVH